MMSELNLRTVSGSLFYRERIALPPEATVSVEIVYRPTDGEEPVAIGYNGFQAGGRQVPLEFSVPYAESEIDGRRNYFIRARIDHDSGSFCFTSAEPVYVITHDNPTSDVTVMMRQTAEPPAAVVTGTVSYRERMMLRPDWTITIRLLDVSRADAPATVLGEQSYALQGRQAPLPFSDTHNPVITRENPSQNVEIWVRSV
jgi:putative lipoprotein